MKPELMTLTTCLTEVCDNCETPNDCQNGCLYRRMWEALDALVLADNSNGTPGGCWICEDKKGNTKDLFYFDSANNMREAKYCPECGRKCV